MKLHQLRYLAAIADSDLTFPPRRRSSTPPNRGVSRQIKLLEDELGFELFMREGRSLTRITAAGQRVVARAQRILREIQAIRTMSLEMRDEQRGSLSIATTHTQARYVLPSVIQKFREQYPQVRLNLQSGNLRADCGAHDLRARRPCDRDRLPGPGSRAACYCPAISGTAASSCRLAHPLAKIERPTLKQLGEYPIVTYVFSLTGPSSLKDTFASAGIEADIVLTARDSDVIKTYVRLGLGVGIVAAMSVDPVADRDLVSIDASHIFPMHTTLGRLPARAVPASLHVRFHAPASPRTWSAPSLRARCVRRIPRR